MHLQEQIWKKISLELHPGDARCDKTATSSGYQQQCHLLNAQKEKSSLFFPMQIGYLSVCYFTRQ